MHKVIMKQITAYTWQIVSDSTNKVVQDNIICRNNHHAAEYAKNYCTSFLNWEYKLELLPGEVEYVNGYKKTNKN